MIRTWIFFLIALLGTGLGGCSDLRPQIADPASQNVPLFRPITEAPPATATARPTLTPRPTSPPSCSDNLKFLLDATIPDGMEVAPNSTLDKRWEVENNGTCNWDERYHLRLIEGPDMGANAVQSLFPARASSQAVIRIQMTAPAQPGVYKSAWQAYNPADQAFGDLIFIKITVTSK
jgi:hypothetical protein